MAIGSKEGSLDAVYETGAIVEKVHSVADLFYAIKHGAMAAVYESREVDHARHLWPLVIYHKDLMYAVNASIISVYLSATKAKELHALVRAELVSRLAEKQASPESIATVMGLFDYMYAELKKVADLTPGYEIKSPELACAPNKKVLAWHRDNINTDSRYTGALRYLRILHGPSTEFAKDTSGTGKTVVQDGATILITTGPNGSVHRYPPDLESRAVFTFWLQPIK